MSLPYFPMFPSDFEAKTSHLTLAEDGAYNRLLRMCWMNPGCTIPADEAWIMRRLRAHSEQDQETVRTVLNEFFTVENGRYSNAKLMQIWLDSNEAHEKRKNAGAKGGKAKSLKNNNSVSSNAVAKPKQPEPEPKKEKELSNDSSKKADAFPTNSDLAEFVREWNSFAKQNDLAQVQKLTDTRKRHLKARLKDCGNLQDVIHILHQTATSSFLMGENKRGWKMDFDFFVTESRFTKIAEGAYDRSTSQPQQSSTNYMAELAAQDFGFAPKQERTDHGQGPIIDGTLQVAKGRS